MNKTWVVDSSALIILGKLSLLNILPQLCDNLIIPDGVANEILNGPAEDKAKSCNKTGPGDLSAENVSNQ